MIKVLVNGGVDPYMRDIDGLIPADLAEQCEHMHCSNFLRSISQKVIVSSLVLLTRDYRLHYIRFPCKFGL